MVIFAGGPVAVSLGKAARLEVCARRWVMVDDGIAKGLECLL